MYTKLLNMVYILDDSGTHPRCGYMQCMVFTPVAHNTETAAAQTYLDTVKKGSRRDSPPNQLGSITVKYRPTCVWTI